MTAVSAILWASAAYVLWGLSPIFWKTLEGVAPMELLIYRVIWSFLFCLPLLIKQGKRDELQSIVRKDFRRLGLLILSAALIGYNWYHYVLAMVTHRVLDSSLGYFMTPLVSVFLGIILLKEKLNRLQTLAVGMAFLGVLVLTIRLGSLPMLPLILSSSFAFYGYVKKLTRVSADMGLLIETGLLSIPCAAYLWIHGLNRYSFGTWCLLIASGPITAVPLVWYAWGVQRVPLFVIGFLQFVSPILQFVLAVYCFGEPFGSDQKWTFLLIWIALAIFSWDLIARINRNRR